MMAKVTIKKAPKPKTIKLKPSVSTTSLAKLKARASKIVR